jgi:hypothetical protein
MFDFLVGGKRLVVTGNRIESELVRETCPSCGGKSCCFDCDGSQGGEFRRRTRRDRGRGRRVGFGQERDRAVGAAADPAAAGADRRGADRVRRPRPAQAHTAASCETPQRRTPGPTWVPRSTLRSKR